LKEQNQEDQKLLDKFGHTKDQIWLLKLFQKYEHLILGVCLKYTKDQEWSKDLKAQVYEKLVAKAQGLEVDSFKKWIYRLCKNHCLDAIRKKGARVSKLEKFRDLQILQEEIVEFSHEQRLIIKEHEVELSYALISAADNLPAQQKLCLELFYLQKCSYMDISQETGLDLKKIKSHLQNGKRNMRNFITKHYNITH